MADAKLFVAFVNGIIRQDIFQDYEITDQMLKDELFHEMEGNTFDAMSRKTRKILGVRIIAQSHRTILPYIQYYKLFWP